MRPLLITTFFFSIAMAYQDCRPSVSMEQALQIAKQYVGEVTSIRLSKSKSTGECYYSVKGQEGTSVIDANSGKLIRFYRSKR